MIIDFHTHILPAIDDGAGDLDCSFKMLQASADQGIDCVIATPHFYGNRDRLESFIRRREEAAEKVAQLIWENDGLPKIKLGAEVAYFPGISRAEEIEKLCVEDTRTLLIEMPFTVWNSKVIDEIYSLIYDRDFDIVVAHIERYLDIPGLRDKLDALRSIPLHLQVNAGSLLEEGILKRKRSRELISWFENGKAGVLGSDCHNVSTRSQNLMHARAKLSPETLRMIDQNSQKLINITENFDRGEHIE